MPKDVLPQNFAEKTFTNTHKTLKFAKVLLSRLFRTVTVYFKTWCCVHVKCTSLRPLLVPQNNVEASVVQGVLVGMAVSKNLEDLDELTQLTFVNTHKTLKFAKVFRYTVVIYSACLPCYHACIVQLTRSVHTRYLQEKCGCQQ